MPPREIEIRNTLRKRLERLNARHSKTESLILDELGLCQGEARVDIAVVNGALHGYEIKSEQDTLKRLPAQSAIYNRVFDTMAIVAPARHLDKIEPMVPTWWGLIEVAEKDGGPVLRYRRRRSQNPQVDPYALAQLLWRDEALQLLEELGLAKGFKSKPNRVLWKRLAENLSLSRLNEAVRHTLKIRQDWRSDVVRV
jgi:hypothetical protein